MHPLFGMNPRCLLYEGFRTILLARGVTVSCPEQIWPGRPFQTDLSCVIQTTPLDGASGEEVAAGEGEELGVGCEVHMTRVQRLYDQSHTVSTSSCAFLTRGGLDYHIA